MMYQRLLSFVLVLLLVASFSVPAMASEVETELGTTIQLTKTTGDVTVTKSSDKPVSVREGMRLYNGYIVTTGAESYAWINLDSSKLIKLDASSSAEIRKNGKLLEVNVRSGSAYFDVSKKLDSSENLNVRTSTMAVGIRGTCGWASMESQLVSQVHLLEGACECAVSDPVTGQARTGELHDGETASCVVYSEDQAGEKCDISISSVSTPEIPGFVLTDLVQNIELCDTILESAGIDILADLAAAAGGTSNGRSADGQSASLEVLGLAEQKLREAEQADVARLQQIQRAEAQQENYIARDNVWIVSDTAGQNSASSRSRVSQPPASLRPAGTASPAETAVRTASPGPAAAQETEQTSAPVAEPTPGPTAELTPEPLTTATSTQTAELSSAPGEPQSVPTAAPESSSAGSSEPTAARTPGPSSTAAAEPSSVTTSGPSSMLSPEPSSTQAPAPSSTPTSEPSPTRVPESSAAPTSGPSSTQTPRPSATPSSQSSSGPTPGATSTPAPTPTPMPGPTYGPTFGPTLAPTPVPVPVPTLAPVPVPTFGPVQEPTVSPAQEPTFSPVSEPTFGPALQPTLAPVPVPTAAPMPEPTFWPATDPTFSPVQVPTFGPVQEPTFTLAPEPTFGPSAIPTPAPEPSPGYTVTFDAAGGTVDGNVSAVTTADGYLSALPHATRSVSGTSGICEFDGWYTAATGGSRVTEATRFAANTTVYAHWKGWTLNGTTLTIFGEGPMDAYSGTAGAWGTGIVNVVIEDGVTSIGEGAFYDCVSLVSISIPNSVTSIGGYAFAGCSSLAGIQIPNGVGSIGLSTFNGCRSLVSVSLPGSVTSIGEYGFANCSNLASVTMPGVTSIGNYAFKDCGRLTDVQFAASVTSIGVGAFAGCPAGLTMPYSVTNGGNTNADLNSSESASGAEQSTAGARKALKSRRSGTAYAITLDAAGGTLETAIYWTDADGKLADLPAPVWEDHVFDGWYTAQTDGERVTEASVFDHDTTIFAHWTKAKAEDSGTADAPVTIRLDGCGGTLKETTLKTDKDGRLTDIPKPERDGHVFGGWYTEKSGGRRIASGSVFTEDTTIFAHWTAADPAPSASPQTQFTIRFDPCGGTVSPSSLKTSEDGRLSSLPSPNRKNCSFAGWYTGKTGGAKVSRSTVYAKDMTLYARWKDGAQSSASPDPADVFTVRLDPCGGIVDPDCLRTDADGNLSTLPVPERENYTFQGWYTDPDGGTRVSAKTVFDRNAKLYARWKAMEPAPSDDDEPAASSSEDTGSRAKADGCADENDSGSTGDSSERD